MYSETVKDHFKNPRNVGEIENPDGVGDVGNPLCGDMMTIYLKVEEDRIKDIKFKTFGCGAAIAVSSMLTEMAKGKTLEEAKKITNKSVAEALEGLPQNKLHCSNLGADALHQAIQNYEDKKAGIVRADPKRPKEPLIHDHRHQEGEKCYCPYCSIEVKEDAVLCKGCGATLKET